MIRHSIEPRWQVTPRKLLGKLANDPICIVYYVISVQSKISFMFIIHDEKLCVECILNWNKFSNSVKIKPSGQGHRKSLHRKRRQFSDAEHGSMEHFFMSNICTMLCFVESLLFTWKSLSIVIFKSILQNVLSVFLHKSKRMASCFSLAIVYEHCEVRLSLLQALHLLFKFNWKKVGGVYRHLAVL